MSCAGVYVDAPQKAVTSEFLGSAFKSVGQLFDTIQEAIDTNAASIQASAAAPLIGAEGMPMCALRPSLIPCSCSSYV